MEMLSRVAAVVVTTLFAPLLPERYRCRWPWPEVIGLPGIQSAHGYLWTLAGFLFWAWGFILYQTEMSELVVAVATDERGSGDVGPITHYGLILYFAFLFTPRGFLLTVLALDGLTRGIAGAMTGSVPGSLYLAVPLAVARWLQAGWRRSRMTSRYGKASEPDRLVEEGDRLRVRRTRPHPEWNADLAFRYRDKLYRLHNFDAVAVVQGRLCFEYTFTPWPEGRTLRRVVNIASVRHVPPERPADHPGQPE